MNSPPLRERFPSLVGVNFEVWVSEGWLTLVTETLSLLLKEQAHTPTLRVDEIKQKWGELIIRGNDFSELANDIVQEATKKSRTICEICGAQGEPKTDRCGRMVAVRCSEHVNVRGQILVPDESNEQARNPQQAR